MKASHRRALAALLCLAVSALLALPLRAKPETPLELFGELFVDVQLQRVFPDSKTFADAVPNERAGDDPAAATVRSVCGRLRSGGVRGAQLQPAAAAGRRAIARCPARTCATTSMGSGRCWSAGPSLASPTARSCRCPSPTSCPAGASREIYYWDSYFTMLGLEQSGRRDLALDMVRNFASLIDRYGHVPNGNRTYYLSRSQPPFFAAMVELVASAAADADAVRAEYLPALSREYAFWMDGADGLAPGSAHRRVVRLSDGTLLNRYWDDRDVPREESYREDVATAAGRGRPAAGGVSRPARRGRERLGLQLALAGGRADARHHPHHRPRAGRSQQCPGPARDRARRRLRRRRALWRRPWRSQPAPSGARRRCDAICGTRSGASSPTISGARIGAAMRSPPRRWPRCSSASPPARKRGAWRQAVRGQLAVAGRSRDHDRALGPAMGRAQRLGAAAVAGDRGPEPLRRDRSSPRPSPSAG